MEEKHKEEPSHPWAHEDSDFDWAEERKTQKREGPRWVENETERLERERSIES